jgi:hypothetical protein
VVKPNSLAIVFAGRTEDELLELIESEDFSLAKIAECWGVTRLQVQRWIDSNPGRRARVETARQNAADACDRKAEAVLLAIPSDATAGDIARARELAAHYRWQARVRNPARYGEKIRIDHALDVQPEQMSDAQLALIAARRGIVIDGEAELLPENGQNA